jgi:hypothetical protein
MRKQATDTLGVRERILAETMRDLATDLRLIDLADFAAFIRLGQFGNVEHLVNSSVELYFQRGTLRFGSSAEAEVGWSSEPRVVLDMVFEADTLSIYFRLVLGQKRAAVEIDYITFSDAALDAEENTLRFEKAIQAARCPRAQADACEWLGGQHIRTPPHKADTSDAA